jgi:hypothetical protein
MVVGPPKVAAKNDEQATAKIVSDAPDQIPEGCAKGEADQWHTALKYDE